MPDDDATRARRYRQHQQGDHSLCKSDHCATAAADSPAVSSLATVVDENPRAGMLAVARRLATLADGEPSNMSYVRELRATLAWLAERGGMRTDDEARYLRRLEVRQN